jgi:hypothetical protein
MKSLLIALAYCLALGGCAFLSSYYYRLSFKQLKQTLVLIALLPDVLLLNHFSEH